jgi:ankyrin repeat protein
LLLSHDGINPNALDQRGSSALHLAAWAGHTDICKLLLKHPTQPADPNIRTAEYETPLHFAAQHGHLTALIELLAKGGDPNITNIREETPLDLAAQYGRLQIVQILIRAHNELLLPLKATATPILHTALHLASRNGHRDIVELLLAAGCNVNILTPNGSAMHEAALCGKEKVVKVLLREGIDLDLTDRDGRTVFDLLNEFPQHVVNRIRTVINNYKPNIYDSESDDLQDNNTGKYSKRAQSANYIDHSSFVINRDRSRTHSNRRYQEYDNYGGTTSPSSMGSFCGPSPVGHIVPITPRSAPLKPPRKSHSISPPSHSQFNLMTQSLDLDYPHNSSNDNLDGSSSTSSNQNQGNNQKKSSGNGKPQRAPYEFLYLSHSGESDEKNQEIKKKTSSNKKKQQETESTTESDYIIMNAPLNIPSDYDSKIVRVANPHRKLRRSRDGFVDASNESE